MIETNRLFLRKWKKQDANILFSYAKDKDVGPVAGWPIHKTVEDSLNVIQNVFIGKQCYAICLKESNKIIGCIELKLQEQSNLVQSDTECELGYWLGKSFWGNGYMTEISEELIKYGFNILNMTSIWCAYYEGNERSKKVQERLGFSFHHKNEGVYLNLLKEKRNVYVNILTKESWMEKNCENKRQ